MTRKIVLIESEASLVQSVRAELEPRGFTVVETADGRSAPDLVRREAPDAVVLAVELAAGQSGYIVCGKLKKDDDLKRIPVIVIGRDAEGFEAHRRLRARAEDYLKKPFPPHLLREHIYALLGLSDEDPTSAPGGVARGPARPPAVIELTAGDPDLAMLDAAFESIAASETGGSSFGEADLGDGPGSLVEALPAPSAFAEPAPDLDATAVAEPELEPEVGPDAFSADGEEPALLDDAAFDSSALPPVPPLDDEEEDVSLDALEVEELPPADEPVRLTPAVRPRAHAGFDDSEVHELRARVAELENRQRDLEDELAQRTSDLEALRSTAGGRDRDVTAFRDQITRKDKELVRLRQELNDREQALIELRERDGQLEQRNAELTADASRRDAQVKLLSGRSETLLAERRRFEAAHAQAKDEIRQLSTALATAQGELDQAQESALEVHRDLEAARAEAERARGALAEQDRHLDARAALEDEKRELEAQRNRLEDDNAELRARISELEQRGVESEERVVKAYQKIKAEEKAREKTRRALAAALQQLDEPAPPPDAAEPDPEAEA